MRPTEPGTAQNRLSPVERFKPLDPDKPLAPYRVPSLKAFDRELPGQGRFDFSPPDPEAVTYADDPE